MYAFPPLKVRLSLVFLSLNSWSFSYKWSTVAAFSVVLEDLVDVAEIDKC